MTGWFLDEIRAHAPDAPALRTPEAVLGYGELATRIDRLASALVRAGLGPEQVCAIAVESRVDAVVAMAAVLHAGGAFLTLDLDQPRPRLARMIDSAGAAFLVTAAAEPPVPVPGPAIRLDRLPTGDSPPTDPPGPGGLAYVSHTSGSTGAPNPVLIERGSLDAYLRFVVDDGGLDAGTVTLQLAPLGYDASIRDVFATLLAGGQLVLVPRATLLRAGGFAAAVAEYGVNTVLSITPSLLTFLSRHDAAAHALRSLRLTLSSGESLRPFLAANGRSLLEGRLLNHYGPTEATMTSTRLDVPAEPDRTADVVGTPRTGVSVRLLDADLRPVPEGAEGEVHLGGAGVARGYHGRPGLTADRFRPDPAGPPGARAYRTGDLARRRPDGTLEYRGRLDRQLKIRGYRVDPAEIEGRLLTHAAIHGAVVTAATDDRGRAHLVAHVAGATAAVTDAALRRHLAETLPPHLLPRRIRRVDRLPSTRTGKTDRSRLSRGDRP
ncbi:amino acid adenylation domain-containing protein [Amycolatopsis sp. NPDC051045]|uniref:amino acid adenylation domain-containing protein n=1 Tax=Amycolatopsis sp. NPDC051045 TaxID=3156922 RepID=UPI003443F664